MTLDNIRNHVIEQAKSETSRARDETRREADRLLANTREEADREFRLAVERLQAELDAALEQETGRLRTEHRMELLKLKSAILDDVFTAAARKLLLSEKYWERTRRQLEELTGQEGQVFCRAEHRERLDRMIREFNARPGAKAPGLAAEAGPGVPGGGFVFRSRTFDIDVSLDSELEAFREKARPEVVAKAFPEE